MHAHRLRAATPRLESWRVEPGGLLFGYAGLSEPAIDEGVALLAAAIDELR
jgi:DNA-binding transcriptional MocR family regulator